MPVSVYLSSHGVGDLKTAECTVSGANLQSVLELRVRSTCRRSSARPRIQCTLHSSSVNKRFPSACFRTMGFLV